MNLNLQNYIKQHKEVEVINKPSKQNPKFIWKVIITIIIVAIAIGFYQWKKPSSIINCGIDKKELDFQDTDPETNDVLVCLGKSLLDNCKASKGTLNLGMMGKINFTIKKGFNQKCVGIIEYGDIDTKNISSTDDKRVAEILANHYIECPLKLESFAEEYMGIKSKEELIKTPGRFALGVYSYIVMESTLYPETQCAGSAFDYYEEIKVESTGKPTPEEALSYAADMLEAGNTKEYLKMFSQSKIYDEREFLENLDELGEEGKEEFIREMVEEIRSSTFAENHLEFGQSERYKTYQRIMKTPTGPNGELEERMVYFDMEKLSDGNWVIGD